MTEYCNIRSCIQYSVMYAHQLTLVRKVDNDAVFRNNAADAGKVVLTKRSWYMPHVAPNLQEKLPRKNFYKNN